MIRKRFIGYTIAMTLLTLLLFGLVEAAIQYFPINMNEEILRMAALAIILALTIGLFMHRASFGVTTPLHRLLASAKQINEGKTDQYIERLRRDEIGQLAEDFETMRIKLNESKQLEAHFEENRKKLMENISKDLKTPVTSIKGCATELRDGTVVSQEEVSRNVQTIHTKALVIDKLIDDLFLFSQLDLGKLAFRFKNIDLRGFFMDIMEEFEKEWDEVSFTFSADQEKSFETRVDPDQIRRVFVSILDNSLKYIDKSDKAIEIHLEEKLGEIIVTMKDNGPGMLDQDLPHIFEHFYRSDMARDVAPRGSGLGLTVAKRVIEEHDGRITASCRKGHSTTITFTLPKKI
ncbi:HAMP domain-containing sensor histidine kinase [Halobacillus rhizosphaerae]|uniref:HAMP domain-containing sensor histidine kinase n=1 Tax=Halobacillus rhizosphaerae TaxID=3064889 RepID=UPI00398B1124